MLRSNRLFVAAVFGLILSGQHKEAWGKDGANQHHYSTQNDAAPATSKNARSDQQNASDAHSEKNKCYPGSEPGISCDGIAAKAAVDQAADADKQTSPIWWQFGVGVGTLVAAIAAAVFAGLAAYYTKKSADIAIKSHDAVISTNRAILRIMGVKVESSDNTCKIIMNVCNIGKSAATIIVTTFYCDQNNIKSGFGYLANKSFHRIIVEPECDSIEVVIGYRPLSKETTWYIAGSLEYETIGTIFKSTFSCSQVWLSENRIGGNRWLVSMLDKVGLPTDT